MTFNLIPVKEVLDYLEKYKNKDDNPDRRKSIKKILKWLKDEVVTAPYAFQNEYGEKYIILAEKPFELWHWAGDESDWELAHSFYEDNYMNQILQAKRVEISREEAIPHKT